MIAMAVSEGEAHQIRQIAKERGGGEKLSTCQKGDGPKVTMESFMIHEMDAIPSRGWG